MAGREARGSTERPLQGVVLCFTSIGPEDRTRYADLAVQMGAEHKLDLTSDTTHLIVGSTDTLKYQYVAKERDDIKVIRPEWVEAVRDSWINDLPLDVDELVQEYRLPTLAGLKICITGFEDLSFRAQLQRNVIENGGDYTGDLTKDVTHLIAARPEGKKYEYGTQWQKKVVSIKWYRDTLERGMQLDEKLYHPALPADEQGVGAWNRRHKPSPRLRKRTREESIVPEPSRKLRRTASARLGSQNQDMWSDIVGGAGFEARSVDRPQLKTSTSMPALRQTDSFANAALNRKSDSFASPAGVENMRPQAPFLEARLFIIRGFDEKKEGLLHKILMEHGGTVVGGEEEPEASEMHQTFLLLPHDVGNGGSLPAKFLSSGYQTVSELWLERCMLHKLLISPEKYPLGQVLPGPLMGFSDLIINATGFDALETLHISKIVTLLGGKYVQVFTSTVSLLLCKNGDTNKQKLELAEHSSIPVVSEEWLWSTIRNRRRARLEDHLIKRQPSRPPMDKATLDRRAVSKDYVEVSTIPIRRDLSGENTRQTSQDNDGSSVTVHNPTLDAEENRDSFGSELAGGLSDHDNLQAGSCDQMGHALQELSSNSPGRRLSTTKSKKASIRSLDGTSSAGESTSGEKGQGEGQHRTQQAEGMNPTNIAAINGAIRDMLDQRTRKKTTNSAPGGDGVRRSRFVGRALSNLSNSSMNSNMRPSRASSVDSINTDGIGSEIVTTLQSEPQGGEATSNGEKATFGFMGRAKTTLAGYQAGAFETNDLDLGRVGIGTEPEAPPMTQLGYEDPEEAILLREKLAESRRRRTKDGARADEPKPAARAKTERKIQDDDIFAGAGWGGGRRTRQQQKSPSGQGMKEF